MVGIWRRPVSEDPDLLEFSCVLILALVLSPLAWSHYYCMLLLPWALYLGGRLSLPRDTKTHRLILCSIVLSSLPVLRLDLLRFVAGPVLSRSIVSACLFGAVLLLVALLRGVLAEARELKP